MISNEGISPLKQCAGCTKYEKGCVYVTKIAELLDNCPSIDSDTVKCTEYDPAREWEDLEQSLLRMNLENREIQYDLTRNQQDDEVDTYITWDSIESIVYTALKLGRKPTGIVIGESALASLDPYGTLKGYKIQAINVLEHTLSVTVSPYLKNRILLQYH